MVPPPDGSFSVKTSIHLVIRICDGVIQAVGVGQDVAIAVVSKARVSPSALVTEVSSFKAL